MNSKAQFYSLTKGDNVNFHHNGLTGWGRITEVRNLGNYGDEYKVLPTRGDPIWIPEDFIWDKQIQGVHPECPICTWVFNNTIAFRLDCGHIICGRCLLQINSCPICRQLIINPRNPTRAIVLIFNPFHNLICVMCGKEITHDMDVYTLRCELYCCFCVPRNIAENLMYKRIFLSFSE